MRDHRKFVSNAKCPAWFAAPRSVTQRCTLGMPNYIDFLRHVRKKTICAIAERAVAGGEMLPTLTWSPFALPRFPVTSAPGWVKFCDE